MKEIFIGKNHAGKTISSFTGESIIIRLEENPSTGFQWEIKFSDDRVFSLQKREFISAQEVTLGSGGIRIFQLKAEEPGTVNIYLSHKKPWDPDESAIDRFEVTLTVESE